MIRPAAPDEAPALSDLALRSKAHWGYSPEFLDACRAELTVDPARCAAGEVLVAERDGVVVGFVAVEGQPPDGELDLLYVDPVAIGSGVGARLLAAARQAARSRGIRRLLIDADPQAEEFYLHHGAVRVGSSRSGSIPGRTLPRLALEP